MKTTLKIFLLMGISLHLISQPINNMGSVGLLNTPSARFLEEGALSMNLFRNDEFSKGNIVAQPYDWLEVSIFYTDIFDKPYESSLGQSYKDKGFSTKILLIEEDSYLPQLAIGLTDFAGTGLFSGEFIVASKEINKFDVTLGLGWGSYDSNIKIKNPFKLFGESFDARNFDSTNVGNFDIDDYFSGKEASIFGSVAYNFQNQTIFLEIGNLDLAYPEAPEEGLRSNYSLGYNYFWNENGISISYGDKGDISFNLFTNRNFSNIQHKSFLQPRQKNDTKIINLIKALQLNDMALKDLYVSNNNELVISVRQNSYQEKNNSVYYTLKALEYSDIKNFDEVIVKNYSFGKEVSADIYNVKKQTLSTSKKSNYEKKISIYERENEFPRTSFSVRPNLKTFLASREGFAYYGLFIESNIVHYFSESIFIDTNLLYSVNDNFDNLFIPPVTTYPAQVRSDIKKYYNKYKNNITIERFEFNWLEKIDNHHLSIRAGLFETMFGGYGFEYLHLNEFSNIAYGFEIFDVKKRDYDQKFNFLEYETVTGHLNFYHYFDPLNMTTHFSWGQYLAGDEGFTLDFSKRFKNGFKLGAYFSLTDVSFDEYGEGSFDKGIYVSLPINNLFNGGSTMTHFKWSPLTKDPAQKLGLRYRNFGLMERYIY